MLSGYATAVEVMKQVSRRGSMRMPAFLIRGKCRRGLLSQFGVQREIRDRKDPEGRTTTRRCFTDCCGMVVT